MYQPISSIVRLDSKITTFCVQPIFIASPSRAGLLS